MSAYLYDTTGAWIAFRNSTEGKYLFDTNGDWIGWFPWADDEAVTPDGDYLGTVVDDRLVREIGHVTRGFPVWPGTPDYPGRPNYPGTASYLGRIDGYEDLAVGQRLTA